MGRQALGSGRDRLQRTFIWKPMEAWEEITWCHNGGLVMTSQDLCKFGVQDNAGGLGQEAVCESFVKLWNP